MNNSELVFVPVPGIGHLVSTLEFAKRLIDHHEQLSVTVLCMKLEFSQYSDAYNKSLVGSHTRIKLIDLPQVDSPPPELLKSLELYIYVAIESVVPHVRNALREILSSSKTKVVGVVLDVFCMPMFELADELGLPSYMFLTCNLGFLGLMLHLASRHDHASSEYEESDPESTLPGFANPVPTRVLPSAVFSKDGGYTTYIKLARRFRQMKGIIVNSFTGLEHYSLDSLSGDEKNPPIYTVGPVLSLASLPHPDSDQAQNEMITEWLDDQPPSSVVFLCFGSMGRFGVSQLREIASGLERSGHRFLWCVRVPEPNTLDEILPEGFLERVGRRGVICNEWAPQVEVLGHRAVGGFVSHCGWNSVLESLWFGVPIATWPLYAEQQLNAFRMVREFEMAVELSLDYRTRGDENDTLLVAADEIDSAVRRLMEGETELRKRVKEMSETARKAVAQGGSSFTAIGQLVNDILELE